MQGYVQLKGNGVDEGSRHRRYVWALCCWAPCLGAIIVAVLQAAPLGVLRTQSEASDLAASILPGGFQQSRLRPWFGQTGRWGSSALHRLLEGNVLDARPQSGIQAAMRPHSSQPEWAAKEIPITPALWYQGDRWSQLVAAAKGKKKGGGGKGGGGAEESSAEDGGDEAAAGKKLLDEAEDKFKKSIDTLKEGLSSLSAGRANPGLLDKVMVDYYGVPTPIGQVAAVRVPSGTNRLMVDVYEKPLMADVEKALFKANIGLTPTNDGQAIYLDMPPVTEERRKELVKQASSLGEEGKVAIRNIRGNVLKGMKKLEKSLGKDTVKDLEADLQKLVKKYEGEAATQVSKRETEILKVR